MSEQDPSLSSNFQEAGEEDGVELTDFSNTASDITEEVSQTAAEVGEEITKVISEVVENVGTALTA